MSKARPLVLWFCLAVCAGAQDVRDVQKSEELYSPLPPPPSGPVARTNAKPTGGLTFASLRQIAFRHNPALAQARARLEAARGKQTQAGLYPNPTIGYHGMQIGLQGTAGQQGMFASQRIVTGNKLQLDTEIAARFVDSEHFQFHSAEQRILTDLQIRSWDVLAAEWRVRLTEELATIGEEVVQSTQRLIDAGQATQNDLLQAQIKADESRILHDNARNSSTAAWRKLAVTAGVSELSPQPLAEELDARLPDLTWDHAQAIVLTNHPLLRAARARAVGARTAVCRAEVEPVPDVNVFVSHRHNNVTDEEVTNVQVGVPVPVFNRNPGNIHAARAEWVRACQEVRQVELRLKDQLATSWKRYLNARQQVERYRQQMVPRAKQSLKLVTDGYDQGQVQYLAVLTAQETFLRVNLRYIDALSELRAATSLIEGRRLSGSLTSNRGDLMRTQ